MMRWISKIIMTFNGLKLNKILFSLPLFLAPTRFKQSSSKCQRHLRSQTKLWRTSTQANSWFNQLFQPYESARSHEQYSDQKINSPIKDLFELPEKNSVMSTTCGRRCTAPTAGSTCATSATCSTQRAQDHADQQDGLWGAGLVQLLV